MCRGNPYIDAPLVEAIISDLLQLGPLGGLGVDEKCEDV